LAGLGPAIHEFHEDIRGRIGNTVQPGPVGRRGQVAAMLPQNVVYRPAEHWQRVNLLRCGNGRARDPRCGSPGDLTRRICLPNASPD